MELVTMDEAALEFGLPYTRPPQLLKWVGNKHRSALAIAKFIPDGFRMYFEPFLGAGAVLGTLAPMRAVAGDFLQPLIEIWQAVQSSPEELAEGYAERWSQYEHDPERTYERIRTRYNAEANRDDLLFLCRSCYGGVVRFTREGRMSTPVGPHRPISPQSLRRRIAEWRPRIQGTRFLTGDFENAMDGAKAGDVVYCDPPYADTQAILYGAQTFSHERLFGAIETSVQRGVKVLLSLDGTKKSGRVRIPIEFPSGLFRRQILLGQGGSMLRRFQMKGESVRNERVEDRLLLTW